MKILTEKMYKGRVITRNNVFTVQVLTWGVRHMKKFQLAAVNSPSIEIECGGVVLSTIKIKNAKKNPNFDTSSMLFDVVRKLMK